MNFEIGDSVAFRYDPILIYRVENIDRQNNKILLRGGDGRDFALQYGWENLDQYIKY